MTCLVFVPKARAESGGTITLSTSDTTIKKGEVFAVVCRVSASNGVLESDFFVDYNTSVLEFVEGGSKATKEVGGVHIQSVDNTDSPDRRTFSLQFLAKKEGDATVFIRDGAHVIDGEGNPLSVGTNRIDLVINETGDEETGAIPPQDGQGEEPVSPVKKSSNTKVKELSTNALMMTPEFDPTVRTYEAEVGSDTDVFFIDYVLADSHARARIKGNKNLKFGSNKVRLIVTAPSGAKKTYVFIVTRMAEKETAEEPVPVTPAAVSQVPLDKEEHNSYSIVLYVIIFVLMIFSVSMVFLVRRQRRELDYYYEEEERKQRETEDDIRG